MVLSTSAAEKLEQEKSATVSVELVTQNVGGHKKQEEVTRGREPVE